MRTHARQIGAALAALALAACGGGPAEQSAASPPKLAAITVAAGDGAGGVAWDGVVQAVEQAVLSAQTSGRVAALAADVDQHVARGALLLRLTGEEQGAGVETARAQLRAAEAQLADAAARFARASDLVGRQLVSRDEFDRVRATHDAALANRDAAVAQLAQLQQQLGYTQVRAPYAGIIAARHVELGETVLPGQPLYTLYAPGQLRLEVQVPQADSDAIRRNAAATITLSDGREVAAAKVLVFPGADPLAHSTTVRVLLPALDAPPRPGETAKVRFAAAAGPAGIWLPAAAVVERGEIAAAYVLQEDGIVMRQLRVGRRAGDRLEILAGLTPGEHVAADPLAALQALRERQAGAGTRGN
jgi:RND family efflux transporter MFP subunit